MDTRVRNAIIVASISAVVVISIAVVPLGNGKTVVENIIEENYIFRQVSVYDDFPRDMLSLRISNDTDDHHVVPRRAGEMMIQGWSGDLFPTATIPHGMDSPLDEHGSRTFTELPTRFEYYDPPLVAGEEPTVKHVTTDPTSVMYIKQISATVQPRIIGSIYTLSGANVVSGDVVMLRGFKFWMRWNAGGSSYFKWHYGDALVAFNADGIGVTYYPAFMVNLTAFINHYGYNGYHDVYSDEYTRVTYTYKPTTYADPYFDLGQDTATEVVNRDGYLINSASTSLATSHFGVDNVKIFSPGDAEVDNIILNTRVREFFSSGVITITSAKFNDLVIYHQLTGAGYPSSDDAGVPIKVFTGYRMVDARRVRDFFFDNYGISLAPGVLFILRGQDMVIPLAAEYYPSDGMTAEAYIVPTEYLNTDWVITVSGEVVPYQWFDFERAAAIGFNVVKVLSRSTFYSDLRIGMATDYFTGATYTSAIVADLQSIA